ncbi:hypothetical protein B0H19DRAFT_1069355 [Mycena capillaripes]|nr:hypothetical protein B0H19DRAFT_1069355 [Mycena capillaripes]
MHARGADEDLEFGGGDAGIKELRSNLSAGLATSSGVPLLTTALYAGTQETAGWRNSAGNSHHLVRAHLKEISKTLHDNRGGLEGVRRPSASFIYHVSTWGTQPSVPIGTVWLPSATTVNSLWLPLATSSYVDSRQTLSLI